MNSKHITLTKWHTQTKLDDNIDIDWPHYHREIGEDKLSWLQGQERLGRCQLLIEQQSSRARLSLEIFDESMVSEYYLMWS